MNLNLCICTKSLKSNLQCNNKKLKNSQFCGKHIKCYNKIGIYGQINKNIINSNDINFENYKYINFNNLHIKILRNLCNKYKISIKNKLKKDISKILYHFMDSYSTILNNKNNINKIIIIQSLFRGNFVRNIYGKMILSKCINSTDIDGTFFWYNINNNISINNNLYYDKLFIFTENNLNYCFLVQSFKKNLLSYGKNPYTTEKFSINTINNFNKRLRFIKKQNINLSNSKTSISKQKKFELYVFNVFQKIESLGNYTDHNWFLNLTLDNLKVFYYSIKNIFFNSAPTIEEKRKFLPLNNAFKMSNYDISIIPSSDKRKLQTIIIKDINKFISSGINIEYQRFAAWIILTALTKVSRNASNALPYNII